MNLKYFKPEIRYQSRSIFSTFDIQLPHTDEHFQNPLLKAFLEDEDFNEVTVTSTCIGFVKTYTKQFKK